MSTRADITITRPAEADPASAGTPERRRLAFDRPLAARSEAGGRLVALAEDLSAGLAQRADEHDREGTFAYEAIDALQSTGYLTAAIPAEHGGLGVDSLHDVVVASSRLARGDASVAIGVNMHHVLVLSVARRWRVAVASGKARRAAAYARVLEGIVRERTVLAAAVSEPGQDVTRPATTAARSDGGWIVDGRKVFATMSPAATALVLSVGYVDDDGRERYGYATVPTDTPGVVVGDDWDAMGMRGSGSGSVTLTGVHLPASGVSGGFPAGSSVGYMERNLPSGLLHAAAALGIAESAFGLSTESVAARGGDGWARMQVADNAVDLATARAVLARSADLIDEHHAAHTASEGAASDVVALFTQSQAAKAAVAAAAQRIVDRSLALSGGAGYLSGHPLGRAYRDVRAISFMHPLGANRASDFLAQVALGEEPDLH
jgi:alkylation response protein AidB-like acyl-CoA dehydrogenase